MKALDLPNDKSLTADNLNLIVDITEQEIERPVQKQKSYYSGKKATYDKNFIAGLLFDRINSGGSLCQRHNARFSNLEKK